MYKITEINKEDKEYFQKFYKQHNVVGLLVMENETRVILKMKQGYKGWTPSGCVRDCGDYLIIANHSTYDKLNKNDMTLIKDVSDK